MSGGVVGGRDVNDRGDRETPAVHKTSEPTRVCGRCEKRKPWGAFHTRPNGLPRSVCRACDNQRRAEQIRERFLTDPSFADLRRCRDRESKRRKKEEEAPRAPGYLPIGPFREWLVSLNMEPGDLAELTGGSSRAVYRWLHVSRVIRLGDLDSALTTACRPDLLAVLYPLEELGVAA